MCLCTFVYLWVTARAKEARAINVPLPTHTTPSARTPGQTKHPVILSQHVSVASPVDQHLHPTSKKKKKKKRHFVPLCPFPLRSGAWVRLNNHWDRGAFHLGDILSPVSETFGDRRRLGGGAWWGALRSDEMELA